MTQMVPVHKFTVHRCPVKYLYDHDEQAPSRTEWEAQKAGWEDGLAAHLAELSRSAKLGPVIVLDSGRAVIVGELDGFIGIEVEVPQIAVPVGMKMPAGNRR
jgi:hypothetical protein